MSDALRQEKMKKKILVVETDTLYHNKQFEGFCSINEYDFESTILNNFEYQERGLMEVDDDFQQPIPYAIVVNPCTNKIIAYQRGGQNSGTADSRIFWNWSLWVWWHIEREEKDAVNPMHTTIVKEIKEETGIESITECKIIWYINDNSDIVGKYHLWVIYLIFTNESEVHVVDGEMEKVFFMTKDEIEDILLSEDCNMESWSKIVWENCKSMF